MREFRISTGVKGTKWRHSDSTLTQNKKDIEPIRIVQFADSHVGTTFSGKGLEKYVSEINSKNPLQEQSALLSFIIVLSIVVYFLSLTFLNIGIYKSPFVPK